MSSSPSAFRFIGIEDSLLREGSFARSYFRTLLPQGSRREQSYHSSDILEHRSNLIHQDGKIAVGSPKISTPLLPDLPTLRRAD